MNDMIVGMENLPNVFIDKIDLHPLVANQQLVGYKVRVKLCMYDHSPKRSWYRREELSDLSIKIVFRGGEAATALNDGSDSLYDYSLNHPAVTVVGQNAFSIEDEMEGYIKLSTSVEMTIPTQDNLNVYAACFISDLNFGNNLFNKFYGALSAEKIFVGGQINENSGYFYYPETNEEYGGPVHSHDGTQMEGSQHSQQPHSRLAYVAEDNYKIRESAYGEGVIVGTPPTVGDPSMAGMDVDNALARGQRQSLLGPNRSDFTDEELSALGEFRRSAARTVDQAAINNALTQRPQAQDLLANVNFEVRDAIRRGIY